MCERSGVCGRACRTPAKPAPTHPNHKPRPRPSPWPRQVGADLCMGSLIKNGGGTIVSGGGYVAGRADLVERAVARLTAPGIGMDAGCVPGETLRLMFQGGRAAALVVLLVEYQGGPVALAVVLLADQRSARLAEGSPPAAPRSAAAGAAGLPAGRPALFLDGPGRSVSAGPLHWVGSQLAPWGQLQARSPLQDPPPLLGPSNPCLAPFPPPCPRRPLACPPDGGRGAQRGPPGGAGPLPRGLQRHPGAGGLQPLVFHHRRAPCILCVFLCVF